MLLIFLIILPTGADHAELLQIAGDKSRVYNIKKFSELQSIKKAVKQTTCKGTKLRCRFDNNKFC